MLRAYKFRVYPTQEQEHTLFRCFGASRFVWNWALNMIKVNYQYIELLKSSWNGNIQTLNITDAMTMEFHGCLDKYDPKTYPIRVNESTCSRLLTSQKVRKKDNLSQDLQTRPGLVDDYPWLTEVPSRPLRYSLRNLGTAFKNFFKSNKNGGHAGYPKNKTKKSVQSIQFQGEDVKLDVDRGYLSLPKIKNIEVKLHRAIVGKIKTTTITKTKSGKYFVSFQVDDGMEHPTTREVNSIIGIDLGISSFVTTSDEEKFDSMKPLREMEPRLQVMNRRFSRKKKGSKNSEKYRIKLARYHEKIANKRSDFQHKLSRYLVESYDAIVIESLNISGMMKNHCLAKSISDEGWFAFLNQLKYKTAWSGKTIVEIGRWEPTSKTCHVCGYKNKEMLLDVREWTCPNCKSIHDRDVNAAINIKASGIEKLR